MKEEKSILQRLVRELCSPRLSTKCSAYRLFENQTQPRRSKSLSLSSLRFEDRQGYWRSKKHFLEKRVFGLIQRHCLATAWGLYPLQRTTFANDPLVYDFRSTNIRSYGNLDDWILRKVPSLSVLDVGKDGEGVVASVAGQVGLADIIMIKAFPSEG